MKKQDIMDPTKYYYISLRYFIDIISVILPIFIAHVEKSTMTAKTESHGKSYKVARAEVRYITYLTIVSVNFEFYCG